MFSPGIFNILVEPLEQGGGQGIPSSLNYPNLPLGFSPCREGGFPVASSNGPTPGLSPGDYLEFQSEFLHPTRVPDSPHCRSLDFWVLLMFHNSLGADTYDAWFKAYHEPGNGGIDVLYATLQATDDVLRFNHGSNVPDLL